MRKSATISYGIECERERTHLRAGFQGDASRIKGGRILDHKGKPERQMCRLYLSMMDKMNVRLPKFGDASKALEEV